MRRAAACVLAMFVTGAAAAFENFEAVPGGIAGIKVGEIDQAAPRVRFGTQQVPVLRYERGWVAVVGLSRDLAPGYYVVNAVDDEAHYESHTFAVSPVSRPIYRIEVSDASELGEVVERHRRALSIPPVDGAANIGDPPDMDFVLPVELPIRFQFGLLNFSGTGYTLDFPGLGFEPGQAADVVNPAFGQVVSIDEHDSRWRLIIHHGDGLISVFRNLESVSVTLEDWVPKGARLATLTGGNGVRLLPDWTVLLGGAQIDPLLLVSQNIRLEQAPVQAVAPAGKIE